MSIISYAQNFEDVMLWRALKNIENGFYIDIGANDPTIDSVSRAFYEKGWRGVHIEPSPEFAEKLREERSDEVIKQVAIGNGSGELVFYEIKDTGLSTADLKIANKHKKNGYNVSELKVKTIPLFSILEEYKEKQIHWLKIDVEGFEKEVISSWGDSSVRPWILIIESTIPHSTDESYQEWEALVLAKGYAFAYFDGLNRFYIHENHIDLLSVFSKPPNVFDEIILSGKATNSLCSLIFIDFKSEVEKEKVKTKLAEEKAQSYMSELQLVYSSNSWRITAPMRWCMLQLSLLKKHGVKGRFKSFIKKISLKKNLESSGSVSNKTISPHAKKIHDDLKTAINNKKEHE